MYNSLNLVSTQSIFEPISANELGRNLKEYLLDRGVTGYLKAKFVITKDTMKVMIAVESKSSLIEINPVAKLNSSIKVKDPFTLSDEFRKILEPFLDAGEDPTMSSYNDDRDRGITKVVINLVPKKVMEVILPKAPEGSSYGINKIILQKGNPLLIFHLRKNRTKKPHNNNKHNNNRGGQNKYKQYLNR